MDPGNEQPANSEPARPDIPRDPCAVRILPPAPKIVREGDTWRWFGITITPHLERHVPYWHHWTDPAHPYKALVKVIDVGSTTTVYGPFTWATVPKEVIVVGAAQGVKVDRVGGVSIHVRIFGHEKSDKDWEPRGGIEEKRC